MRATNLHREYAIKFLHDYAAMAYAGFVVAIVAIGVLLHKEEVPYSLLWMSVAIFIESVSFFLRYHNNKIYKTFDSRERFGLVANLIDGLVISSCLIFLSSVSVTTAVFMSSILLLLCSASSTTSAGYQPLLWCFSAPIFIFQFIFFSYYYWLTEIYFYAIVAIIALIKPYLVYGMAKKTRNGIFALINANLEIEKVEQSKRVNQAKSRFFAASTHDLRQPLSASAAFLTVATKLSEDKRVDKFLFKALNAVELVDQQLSPIMELARIDSDSISVNFESIELVSFVRDTLSMFGEQIPNGIMLRYNIDVAEAVCKSDTVLLRRCIMNIVDNSLKYTEAGVVDVTLASKGSNYLLTVRDTGIGIEKENLDLVLDEFYQVSNPDRDPSKGFGLGLPIVYRICYKLGIKMRIKSEVNVFTEVALVIPKKVALDNA